MLWWFFLACGGSVSDVRTPADEATDPADAVYGDTGDGTSSGAPAPSDTAEPSSSSSSTMSAACGDGTCAGDESCWSCASDCGSCDCPLEADVVVYTQGAWNVLLDAFEDNPSFCADYYVSLPAISTGKTEPRAGGDPESVRDRGARFHAMAEFHWSTWSKTTGSWYDKGVEFRRRMKDAGYDTAAGDTWAINELPSTVRYDETTRNNAMELFRGLYDGPDGDGVKGAVFVVGMGHNTTNMSVYEPYLQDWLEDANFWAKANLYVSFWGQEVYADPHYTCVDGATVAERSTALNHYTQHVAWYAENGPDSANTAQSYLGRAYVPMMNAVWNTSGKGYGDTTITLDQMKHFVSTEVYAARAWGGSHNHPDGRIGFAWARYDASDDELAELAERMALAIRYAYDEGGGSAAKACSPSGAYTWCACEVSGAAFNGAWDTFSKW